MNAFWVFLLIYLQDSLHIKICACNFLIICYLPALLHGRPCRRELPATGEGGVDGVGLLAGVELALALALGIGASVSILISLTANDIPPVAAN